jgi:cation diffusion facilitator family transporter
MESMAATSEAPDPTIGENRRAMRLSLAVGVVLLGTKWVAYFLTDSTAILSDAAESVVHVMAVAFAAFSLWLSTKPASRQYTYGYERISFFSAGFEGALIILAAVTIIFSAVQSWLSGLELENLGSGVLLVAGAGLVNAGLGWYLVRTGRKTHSLILEANGKHVLADSWTSAGVVGGLCLVLLTGWKPFDPLVAIAVAVNILWSGGKLVHKSVSGLLDYSDPEVGKLIRARLDQLSKENGIQYHGVRFRNSGYRIQIELHLLFPFETPLGEAHEIATSIEHQLSSALAQPADILTHLESSEDHGKVHPVQHHTGRPG